MTYLAELLRAAQPEEFGFKVVIVWGGESTLNQIENRSWLHKIHEPMLDKSLLLRLVWQRFYLNRLARQQRCDILFIPGGTYFGSFRPFVTSSLNMLPFEWSEARRYGVSWLTLKFLVTRRINLTTFRKADGLIFLSEFARATISPFLNGIKGRVAQIPDGVGECFRKEPRPQRPISTYSAASPFHLLYVSHVSPYKHQWHVMEAVYRLRQTGLPLVLELIGPIYYSRRRFNKALAKWDPNGEWVRYRGEIPYSTINLAYQDADLFVFASSCESLGIILLEAMASGLSIASSKLGPMPAILGNAAVYFDPDQPGEIADAIKTLVEDPHLREEKSRASYEAAKSYTWERCAYETFNLFAQVGQSIGAKLK